MSNIPQDNKGRKFANNIYRAVFPQAKGQACHNSCLSVAEVGLIDLPVLKASQANSTHESKPTGRKRYMPGLDGLRALAVLAVIAYHFNLSWITGGFLGVCLFFVLSGYLITDLLAAQWSLSGDLELKSFWQQRARRLLPAVIVMLAGVVTWLAIFDSARLASLWEDVLATMLYATNWWLIFHHVSYFASFGPPSPLNHLWSLAVEEQFYLVWPLLLWLGLRYVPSRKRLIGLIMAGAMVSAAAMALIFQPGMDPSRVYYGTDTRAFALLIGAALALLLPSRKFSAKISSRARCTLDVIGGTGLLIVVLMMLYINEYETFLYRGGLLLFSLASALVIAVLAHPASRLSKLFGLKPLRWLGIRSYSIYLWHYPIIILTTPAVNTGGPNILLILMQLTTSILLAALTYRYIEEPFRRGKWKKLWSQISNREQRNLIPVGGWITFMGIFLILAISCLVITVIATTNIKFTNLFPSGNAAISANNEQPPEKPESQITPPPETYSPSQPLNNPQPESTTDSQRKAQTDANSSETDPTVTPVTGQDVTIIGDSVMDGAEDTLKKLLPGITIDAQVGRQLYQAPAVVEQLKAQDKLGSRVVIELGSNGPFTDKQLTALLDSLGQVQQIILVNTRVPRKWEGVVNQTLEQVAATYPRTKLIDWYSASSGHNDYFYQDGVHLNPTGIQAYASFIIKAINSQ